MVDVQIEKGPLLHLIERLADNKYWLGRRYAEWCTAAPTLESAVAAAAMAQDEIGHARSHYPLFRHLTGVGVEPESRTVFHSMSYLDQPFSGWTDFVSANFLIDTALTILYESALESSYEDLRHRAQRIVGEEQVHWLHGKGWVRRLLGAGDAMRARLLDSLDRAWLHAVMWFGPSDDPEMLALWATGIVNASPDELRTAFLDRVGPILSTDADVPFAIRYSKRSGHWEIWKPLPWERWDSERYRLREEI
jgi:phenylacetate-CoA oxygenase PaaI subunit